MTLTAAAYGRRTRDKKGKKNCRIVIGLYKGTHVCTNPLLIRTRMCNVVLRYVHTAQYQFCRVSVLNMNHKLIAELSRLIVDLVFKLKICK